MESNSGTSLKALLIESSQVSQQLSPLFEFVSKVWHSNLKIIEMLTMILEKPSPTLHYTWSQAPVKFEDALGRILPIPSEFDWPVSLS